MSKVYELRWSDICRALRATGQMKDFSRGECFRVNGLLKQQIEAGKVERLKRGLYRLTVEDEGSIDLSAPE